MTEKEIFEKVIVEWFNIKAHSSEVDDNKSEYVLYGDYGNNQDDDRFKKLGYDEFEASAIFDKEGNIIKANLISHVVFSTDNHKEIFYKIEELKKGK